MIQELNENTFIAFDGEKKLIFDVDAETYKKYASNNAREVSKGVGEEVVFERIYNCKKTTYTLTHHLNILGIPIFFIDKIVTEELKNFKHTVPHITNDVAVTC